MTKKTLIELMLENNVKWPELATHAVQDRKSLKVCFCSNGKPIRKSGGSHWYSPKPGGFISGCSVKLPELCRNWHQTIVTREQYEKAKEMRDGAERNSEDAKPSKCIGKLHVDLQVSDIISQIAHHQAESQRHEEAMLDHNEKEIALRDQLNEMLAKVGMKVVDAEREVATENGGWHDYCDENGIVVDWDRVPEGSEVECVGRDGSYLFKEGGVYVVGNDECGDYGPLYDENHAPTKSAINLYKFRLIK